MHGCTQDLIGSIVRQVTDINAAIASSPARPATTLSVLDAVTTDVKGLGARVAESAGAASYLADGADDLHTVIAGFAARSASSALPAGRAEQADISPLAPSMCSLGPVGCRGKRRGFRFRPPLASLGQGERILKQCKNDRRLSPLGANQQQGKSDGSKRVGRRWIWRRLLTSTKPRPCATSSCRCSAVSIDASAAERVGARRAGADVRRQDLGTDRDNPCEATFTKVSTRFKNHAADIAWTFTRCSPRRLSNEEKSADRDDLRTIRNMLLVTLNNAGFETIQAEDGVEGLEVLESPIPTSSSPTSTCRV